MLCGKFPPEVSGKESLAFQHQLNRIGTQSEKSLLSKLYQPRAPLGSPQVKEEDGGGGQMSSSAAAHQGICPGVLEGIRGGQVTLGNSKNISTFHRE